MANCVYCGLSHLTLVPHSTAIAKTVANTAKAVNNDGGEYTRTTEPRLPAAVLEPLTVIVDLDDRTMTLVAHRLRHGSISFGSLSTSRRALAA